MLRATESHERVMMKDIGQLKTKKQPQACVCVSHVSAPQWSRDGGERLCEVFEKAFRKETFGRKQNKTTNQSSKSSELQVRLFEGMLTNWYGRWGWRFQELTSPVGSVCLSSAR